MKKISVTTKKELISKNNSLSVVNRPNSSLQTKTKKEPITGKKWNVTYQSGRSLNYLTKFNFSYHEQDTIRFFFWATYKKDFSNHKKGN